MSDLNTRVNKFLWSGQEEVFKAGMNQTNACTSFVSMQVTRMFMTALVLVVWALNFYVNVKKCVMYLNFWALTFTLLYLLCVLPSAGRQEVERKLKMKN